MTAKKKKPELDEKFFMGPKRTGKDAIEISYMTIQFPKEHTNLLKEKRVNISKVCRDAIEKAYLAVAP